MTSTWARLVVPSLAVTEICHVLADPQRRGRVGLAAEFCAAIADSAPITGGLLCSQLLTGTPAWLVPLRVRLDDYLAADA